MTRRDKPELGSPLTTVTLAAFSEVSKKQDKGKYLKF